MVYLLSIGSVILVSLISVIAAIPFLMKKNISKQTLTLLLAFSIGTLLGVILIHFIPEMIHEEYTMQTAVMVLAGFIIFFFVEKFIHHHHRHDLTEAHSHAYHLGPLNILGEFIHNFLDGLLIAASYTVSIPLGVAATISVIAHEIPQELADMAILIYSGLNKKTAVLYNFIAATSAIVGAVVAIVANTLLEEITHYILPLATGSFLYIVGVSLVPQLHRYNALKQTVMQFLAIIIGFVLMFFLSGVFAH